MTTITRTQLKTRRVSELEHLRAKAALLDDLVELIEDKYLGYLMKITENEKNISLLKAKKLLVE
ncbi:MAG: hypothetical protein HYW88_01830 [Candidatus Sungbacteria bacterium]|nr:hypothetical protein [Candidatus Sungbacteria bacterium]